MRTFKRALVVLPLIILTLSIMWRAGPVSANPGLWVSGAKLETTVSPDQIIQHRMTVGLRIDDSPMDIVVEPRDFGSYSAKGFIAVDRPAFHLDPGQSQDVVATIRIPTDVGPGGRYAIVHIRQAAGPESGVGVLVAVDVPVLLTIKGSDLLHKGRITQMTVGTPVNGQSIPITIVFENTGNHHYRVKGSVTVLGPAGETVDIGQIPLSPAPLIPSLSAQLEYDFLPNRQLPSGNYSAVSKVMLEDDTVLDQATSPFQVAVPYSPATPTVSPTAEPSPIASTAPVSPSPVGASSTTVPARPAGVNWLLILALFLGAVILGLVATLSLMRLRRSHHA